jgi:hypothetical protein
MLWAAGALRHGCCGGLITSTDNFLLTESGYACWVEDELPVYFTAELAILMMMHTW